jgi:glutathione S-transferase
MPLALYGHPFSSYTQKVLIALYENATPFELRCIGPDTPEHSAEWLRRWPLAKFPLLLDGERSVVETSIIIEYLELAHPGPVVCCRRTRCPRSTCASSTASSTCT